MLLSHIDLRVRDRAAATDFYDAFLTLLGAVKEVGETFTTWQIPPSDASAEWSAEEWFGITEDRAMIPNTTRVAFAAPSRGTIDAIATYLPAIGARDIEMADGLYGEDYYAVFFSDLDGNKLEIVCLD